MDYEKIVMTLSLAIVAAILFWGVITMARGGDYNRNYSNKIMRYRIILQALALLVFVLILWFREPRG
ncbi:MAG: twin transmembrane helix small protein [Candidatus Puniceispirillaceae bacterium]